ncbi:hypothetical protein [Methylosinus sp. RM1]|uniref:hypothetical protein n=1 Tax=Methylosinus sp. RM1 TaxID=2583817 RepID=UPI00140D2579|nr:hypothetical protein [Methylosinus sp. RM1]
MVNNCLGCIVTKIVSESFGIPEHLLARRALFRCQTRWIGLLHQIKIGLIAELRRLLTKLIQYRILYFVYAGVIARMTDCTGRIRQFRII